MLLFPQQELKIKVGKMKEGGKKQKKKKDKKEIWKGEKDSIGWGEQYPKEWGNCFSLGKGLLFSRKMAAVGSRYTLLQKSSQLLPHISPHCLPLQTLQSVPSSLH